jgi:hypothetical protein
VSIRVMSWVWDNSPYEGKALLIHLALADYANDGGECFPSQTTIAKKARCTDRYVRDTISVMQKDGMVEIVHQSTGKDSHRYRLIARNSVPGRNSEADTPEVDVNNPGTALPKNRQEPLKKPTCVYCKRKFDASSAHNCSAMNQRMS